MVAMSNLVVQPKPRAPLEMREAPLPDPTDHWVNVEMKTTGLCRSQLLLMEMDFNNPMLFGHEGLGTVTGIGSKVTRVKEGDTVLITWIPKFDADGRAPEVAEVKVGNEVCRAPYVYTWADRVRVDESFVFPLKDKKHQFDEVAILGCPVPTGAGVFLKTPELQDAQSVAIVGVGGVGLAALLGAVATKRPQIIAVDIDDAKLDFARRLGATDVVNSRMNDPVAAVRKLSIGGLGVDCVLDCVSTATTTNQAIAMARDGQVGVRRGGNILLLGVPHPPVETNLLQLLSQQKRLIGTMAGGCNQCDLNRFLEWQVNGEMDMAALVTNRYGFDEIFSAVEDLRQGRIPGRGLVHF